MHIEFLVEEPSAEAALRHLLPRILRPRTTFAIHPHQGKRDLLLKLPSRLRAYARWLPTDYRLCVLVDEDRQDCRALKSVLRRHARAAGVAALNRIAIEEIEAWFFGDIEAVAVAYPGVSPALGRQAAFRDPDAVRGGTWEALERELRRRGHFRTGLRKMEAADAIARHMDPERNRSRSFRAFRDGLRALEGG
ncbi:MAG: DUF4276 family protein [Armatimonadetes bacterium]|nr:DUF4276 family protein [Armatimonadota bacterium]